MNFKKIFKRKTRVRLCPACRKGFKALDRAKIVKARSASDCDMNVSSLRFNSEQLRNLIKWIPNGTATCKCGRSTTTTTTFIKCESCEETFRYEGEEECFMYLDAEAEQMEEQMEENKTYTVTRFFQDPDKESKTVHTGLSLKAAKSHCNNPATSGDGWFDGFQEE